MELFKNLPQMETKQLILRQFNHNDVNDVFEYASEPDIAKFVVWYAHTSKFESLEFINNTVEAYLKNKPAPWAIVSKKNGKVIGSIGFNKFDTENEKADIGFAISKKYWGKGITSHALKLIIDYGFSKLELNRIEAHCIIGNKASARVLEKAGMKYEGTFREFTKIKGKFISAKFYAILKSEWGKL